VARLTTAQRAAAPRAPAAEGARQTADGRYFFRGKGKPMGKIGTVRRLVTAGCAAVVLAACASSGAGGDAGGTERGRALTVRVTNDLVPPAQITVWMLSETGGRRKLGTVQPNQEREFSYVPAGRGLEHRLSAEAIDGRAITSDPFTLVGVTAVSWGPGLSAVLLETGRTESR